MWRIAEIAIVDMQHIAENGMIDFGEHHARKYTARLLDMFDTLAEMPYLAQERQASFHVVRIMPCGAHNIVYMVDDEDVVILRVLHGLQNWFELL